MAPAFTDAHVHFWDRGLRDYPWLAAHPEIAGPHLPADLARESAPAAPDRAVFVQADCGRGAAIGEADWAASLQGPVPVAAVVAFAPMDGGASTIAALRDLVGRPLVRGVRHLIQDESDPSFCLSDAFTLGVRQCGEVGLSFDLCVRHTQLAAAAELVRRCPATAFVLDHAGKPDLRSNALDPWRSQIADLARCPNATCKLSGLATEAGSAALDPERYVPTINHLLETFGPSRLMFGSDWPVVKLACPYPTWFNMATRLLSHLSAPARAEIFGGTAARVYRLD